jgi:hypothetical protein
MMVAPLDAHSLLYIAMNLREWDAREIYATRWVDDPLLLVDDSLSAAAQPGSIAHVVGLEKPIAAIGMRPISPGVYGAWCYGTNEFVRIGKSLTKLVVQSMIPALLAAGGHRAECRSIDGHEDAHRWLEYLGFIREGAPQRDFGRNRETFHLYAWRLSDYEGAHP